jgi:DNA (cytosine-5)-methyltransferase 1
MAGGGGEQEAAALAGAVIAAHRHNGDGKHISEPMDTATSTHEKALLLASTAALIGAAGNTYEAPGSNCRSRGLDQPLWAQTATNATGLLAPPLAVAIDNYQGAPRCAGEPLPTQVGSETLGLLTARVLPNRENGTSRSLGQPTETFVGNAGGGGLGLLSSGVVPLRNGSAPVGHGDPLPTATASQTLGLLTAAGSIKNNGPIEEAKYRAHPLSDPLGTVVSSAVTQGLLFGGWYKQNGSTGSETAPHPLTDPFGAFTARDTTGLLTAEWRAALAELTLDDCYFRMMFPWEVGRGCGFDVDFPDHQGDFIVWGSAKDQVDGFGNAVSPPVGAWIGMRLRAILDTPEAVM